MVWASIEKRRRIRRQESGHDGGAGERKRGKPDNSDKSFLILSNHLLDNIRNDLSELSGEKAQDRVQWRRLIRIIDPT